MIPKSPLALGILMLVCIGLAIVGVVVWLHWVADRNDMSLANWTSPTLPTPNQAYTPPGYTPPERKRLKAGDTYDGALILHCVKYHRQPDDDPEYYGFVDDTQSDVLFAKYDGIITRMRVADS